MRNLFLTDAQTTAFEATILDARPSKTGNEIEIVLDRTYFYPEGGGQPGDQGRLGPLEVVDCQWQGDDVVHICSLSELDQGRDALIQKLVGQTLGATINVNRRRDFMQQHSGQHLLSAILDKDYNTATLGFHMTTENLTIDTDTLLSDQAWQDIEVMCNKMIRQPLKMSIHFVEPHDLGHYPLRKQPKVTSGIRLVGLDSNSPQHPYDFFDIVPCGGTHVQSTHEIGLIKIQRVEKYKGGQRCYFACGDRAIAAMQLEASIIRHLNRQFSCPTENLIDATSMMIEKQKETQDRLNLVLINQANERCESLIERAHQAKSTFMVPLVHALYEATEGFDDQQYKFLCAALAKRAPLEGVSYLVAFCDDNTAKPIYQMVLFTHSSFTQLRATDAKTLYTLAQDQGAKGLKGGGSGDRIQAGAPNRQTLEEAFNLIQRGLYA